MAGYPRATPSYYVAIALLAVGLLLFAGLFVLLTTGRHFGGASFDVGPAVATDCPVGGHATVCYRFEVRNAGGSAAIATCSVTAASGSDATFQDGASITTLPLDAGQARSLYVNVVPAGSQTLAPPSVGCRPS